MMQKKKKAEKAVPVSTFAKGGLATLKKYGRKHFVDLAHKRWNPSKKGKKAGKAKK